MSSLAEQTSSTSTKNLRSQGTGERAGKLSDGRGSPGDVGEGRGAGERGERGHLNGKSTPSSEMLMKKKGGERSRGTKTTSSVGISKSSLLAGEILEILELQVGGWKRPRRRKEGWWKEGGVLVRAIIVVRKCLYTRRKSSLLLSPPPSPPLSASFLFITGIIPVVLSSQDELVVEVSGRRRHGLLFFPFSVSREKERHRETGRPVCLLFFFPRGFWRLCSFFR